MAARVVSLTAKITGVPTMVTELLAQQGETAVLNMMINASQWMLVAVAMV
jgi:hypothetical protein